MGLFIKQDFISHSGLQLHWKIECDALGDGDWEALAQIASEVLPPFSHVYGVPRGGQPFEEALLAHRTEDAMTMLIADDVLTTGNSMVSARAGCEASWPELSMLGVVAFSRTRDQFSWIKPLFQIAGPRS